VGNWVEHTANALAFAIIGTNSLLDLQAVVIDGDLPESLITDIISRVAEHVAQAAPPDFFTPQLVPGTMGDVAAAVGAGLLPMYATFSPNLATLLKADAH
jgi:predicted NBD/HSP70 family sugar kinase